MTDIILQKIKEADLILIGIGELCDRSDDMVPCDDQYKKVLNKIEKEVWLLPFIMSQVAEKYSKEEFEYCKKLYSLIENKDYFIVSLCMDGLIHKAEIDEKKLVEPCGSYQLMQCSQKCNVDLYDLPDSLKEQIEAFVDGKLSVNELKEPICSKCGSPMVFNNRKEKHYVEEGYLENWNRYTNWLRNSVNKNICIIEIGVGMKYPTAIRWPFEKIAYYNQKAFLIRIHNSLYQIPEEIKDRSIGIKMHPRDLFIELSKKY